MISISIWGDYMALYRWKRYSVNAEKKWDAEKVATGKKSTLSIGVHVCYAKNLTELGNMINVDDGQIHWDQESSFSAFGQEFDLSWYYAGNADSILPAEYERITWYNGNCIICCNDGKGYTEMLVFESK